MVDNEKIEAAAQEYCDEMLETFGYVDTSVIDAFTKGANWALQEFKKSLWKAPVIIPEINRDIVAISKKGESYTFYYNSISSIRKNFSICQIERWCYLSDLLPKEGDL